MHNGRKLVADTFCDVYNLLEPWIDHGFWDFESYDPEPGSICIVGRKQAVENTEKLRNLCLQDCQVVFANSAEGSSTQLAQLRMLKLEDLILQGKMLLLTGGRQSSQYPCLLHEHFMVRILAYEENLAEMEKTPEIFSNTNKPYKFLFLNGRSRPHRKYLWHRFRQLGLLDQCLWTMLDGRGSGNKILKLIENDRDLMLDTTPIRHLPPKYEVSRYRQNQIKSPDYPHQFIKFDIFDNQWGEIYLEAAPYIDSYFSLVTETVLEHPYSFFTEKISKPLAIGHPWIAASNRGFYRDIRNLGFRTFSHVIDESWDSIDHDQDRMDRIVQVVSDLSRQDLGSFLSACESTCKYNQQHLHHVVQQENSSFAQRFFQFIDTKWKT
jgi:hypothetical protein